MIINETDALVIVIKNGVLIMKKNNESYNNKVMQ